MKVLKFGGTSVGSVESILNVKKIVEEVNDAAIVVVSALGGITDKLLVTSMMAAEGNEQYQQEMNLIVERHLNMIEEVVDEERQKEVTSKVMVLMDELKKIFSGVFLINDLSEKTKATIVSYGERLSSIIVSSIITDAKLYDSRRFIKTKKEYRKNIVDFETTTRLVRSTFSSLPKVAVVPGFIASDLLNGEVTNLGRGGSDYTASILAAILHASVLEIWTDVDGFMTADPRVIKNAYVIDHLSFTEAMELCNFGAKVIYPPTIYPVFLKNIPIRVRNTFNPATPGTLITKKTNCIQEKALIKGMSSISDTCLITVQGLGMVGVIGVNNRIFSTLAKNEISVFMVSQASSENNTTFAVKNEDADLAVKVLNEEFKLERSQGEMNDMKAQHDLATVAIVGEHMKHTPGIAGQLFGTLGRAGISIIACAQGASETNISFVIQKDQIRKALNSIHDSFFLSEYKELNLFITGTGLVGSKLIMQIKEQQKKLMSSQLKINIIGIANSHKMLFNKDGLELETCLQRLRDEGEKSYPQLLNDKIIEMNIFNSVFVDCTSSAEIAALYENFLSRNISVVAANKVSASSPYDNYISLKEMARKRGVKYLFETNVGAGLPIINTMNSLINSGDRILKLEAVLSGTLNFVFNELKAEVPFSEAIRRARQAGYSEPDPRVDLSGVDVIRKLVILARESGYCVEQSDVRRHLFIPNEFFEGTISDFWEAIKPLDKNFELKRQQLEAEGKRLRFVAKMNYGVCEVGLESVDQTHPFYDLEGSNNIIMITTERYCDYPMIIKGYGAGADVTAAGVFADIISIANVR